MGNKMNKVLPGLYIGSARDAHDVEELRENKITHILSVHENAKPDLPDKQYLCLSVADSPSQDIMCYFTPANYFIHKARRTGNVLVHCQMGVSRSAAIVVAYLMTVTRLSWKDALAALKAVRPFISPNLGFQKQLMVFDQKYVEEERTRLKTMFPLSQFNDVFHCEQLLEIYRMSQLRSEQPMDVGVYPLALAAYGVNDFASLRRESNPAGVVFCGPVSDASSEEDCLVRRLEHIHLTETFKNVDTFSCGARPTSSFVVKTKSPEVNTPSTSSLNDDVRETSSVSWPENTALLSGFLNSAVTRESRPQDPNTSNDAAVEMLFRNSAEVSKNSTKSNTPLMSSLNSEARRESGPHDPKSSNVDALEMLFRNSAEVSNNSAKSNAPLTTSSLNSEARRESGPHDPKSSNIDALEMFFRNSVEVSKNSAKNEALQLSSLPNSEARRDTGPHDPKSSNDAALDMLFRNSVDSSKVSAKNDTEKIPRSRPQFAEPPLPEAVVDSIFTSSDVSSRHSIGKESSEVKNGQAADKESSEAKDAQVSKPLTQKELREIGKKYLQRNVSIWHNMRDRDNDEDDDKILSAARMTDNNPFQSKIKSIDPTQDKFADNNSFESKIKSIDPTQNKFASNGSIQLIKITGNDPTQNMVTGSNHSQKKIKSNEPTQLIRITSNDPGQTTITGKDPTQRRLSDNSEEVITVLPSKSQLDQIFQD